MTNQIKWLLREKYNGVESEEFQSDVARIKMGEPLAYVIGFVPFLNTKIYLDSKPLIPRPETEYWVSQAIEEIKKLDILKPKILDLCAGSGCIGVAVLKEIPEAHVDFAEIDLAHHQTIWKNLKENDLDASRVHIFDGDLFENISETYDIILSNPPYINPELADRVEKNVRIYEPELALYGGNVGLEIIERILRNTPAHLNPDGLLYIEHEPEQMSILARSFSGIEFRKDQFGQARFSVISLVALSGNFC